LLDIAVQTVYVEVFGYAGGKYYVQVNYNGVTPTSTPSILPTSSPSTTVSPSRVVTPSTSPGSSEANMNIVTIFPGTTFTGSVPQSQWKYYAFTIPYSGTFTVYVTALTVNGDPDIKLFVVRPASAGASNAVKSSSLTGSDWISVFPSDSFYTGIFQV
jgi:hypothetical protein